MGPSVTPFPSSDPAALDPAAVFQVPHSSGSSGPVTSVEAQRGAGSTGTFTFVRRLLGEPK
ncbi:hypothetical protein EYF80_030962 [Liparis tanakae]|uniref:Uncharacterized protein n=1 Tax=Liparis tanakae TaxID=230148 RepID=A0A4Z2H161_9TELE|nr:hypothetical protein EYF80_030962 [Liparis tanakae]